MRPGSAMRGFASTAIAAALCLPAGASGDPAGPASPPPAPSCQAEDEAARLAAAAELLESVRRRPARRAPSAQVVESLDNRGYAYGPAPGPLADLPFDEPR